MKRALFPFALTTLFSCASTTLPPVSDACSLLRSADIEAVQHEAPRDTKASIQRSGSLEFRQCFYVLPTFANSVSLGATAGGRGEVREWWRDRFIARERERESEREREREAGVVPKRMSGIGDDAYWIGIQIGATLYVRKGNLIVRVGVGGNDPEAVRLQKSKALAASALANLR